MIILDNFLEKEYLISIQETIPKLNWQLHGSVDKDNFFNSVTNDIIFKPLYDKVLNLTELKINSIIRWYINCNPSGENHAGDWHSDDGDITALFYPYPWNTKIWGGGTSFKDSNETIDYKENRLVLFDAIKYHKADKHNNPNMRFSIAFKLKAEWNEDSINNRYTLGSS